MSRLTLALALALASPAAAQAQRVSVPELGRSFASVQAAVSAIGAGRGTVRLAPGEYRECAVQEAGDVRIEAAPGTVTFVGTACEGKAALVLRGRTASVVGVNFRGIRVPDRNGSGIRHEAGRLTVERSRFIDSEQGILTANDPALSLSVVRSDFSGLGDNDGGPSHGLYAGAIGRLEVRECRFDRGTGGHYVKSRAAENIILNSTFDDSRGRATNYMIDLAGGGRGTIGGNLFIQGAKKENYSAFIAVAAEVREHAGEVTVENNRAQFAPGVTRESVFVAGWRGVRPVLRANTLAPNLRAWEAR